MPFPDFHPQGKILIAKRLKSRVMLSKKKMFIGNWQCLPNCCVLLWWCLVVSIWWCLGGVHDAVKRKWSASATQTTRRIVHCAALVAPRFSVQAIASKKPTRRPCINLLSPAAHPVSLTLLSSSPITVSVVFPRMPAIAHYVKYTTFQTSL